MKTLVTMMVLSGFFAGTLKPACAKEMDNAIVQQAECGPKTENGIGWAVVTLPGGFFSKAREERHLIANSELCRKIQSPLSLNPDGMVPYIVSIAVRTTLSESATRFRLTISSKGIQDMEEEGIVTYKERNAYAVTEGHAFDFLKIENAR